MNQTASKSRKAPANPPIAKDGFFELRLYVAGQNAKSITALSNLKSICEEHMPGNYHIEVIDLVQNPALADGDQIFAVPTLVRKLPEPMRKIIGDLSNTERVLVGLDLRTVRGPQLSPPLPGGVDNLMQASTG